ncbi:MAG: SDR family NAD(P)-dependent oxidoreductase [Ferrimonas sp.]
MARVLITGASSGIGAQLAQDYARQGWHVFACGRDETRLTALQAFGQVQPLLFDVTSPEQVQQALQGVTALDLVILNAGTCEYMSVTNWQVTPFEQVIQTNLSSISYCLAALLPNLTAGSTLAIVDSLARLLPFTRSQAYGASKAAVHFLTQTLAVDLASQGIRVCAISPGFVRTPLTDRNTFAMPALMNVEQASARIQTGLAKGKAVVAFPRRLYWPLLLMSRLPYRCRVWLAQRMRTA